MNTVTLKIITGALLFTAFMSAAAFADVGKPSTDDVNLNILIAENEKNVQSMLSSDTLLDHTYEMDQLGKGDYKLVVIKSISDRL